jgi:hypothetical protein
VSFAYNPIFTTEAQRTRRKQDEITEKTPCKNSPNHFFDWWLSESLQAKYPYYYPAFSCFFNKIIFNKTCITLPLFRLQIRLSTEKLFNIYHGKHRIHGMFHEVQMGFRQQGVLHVFQRSLFLFSVCSVLSVVNIFGCVQRLFLALRDETFLLFASSRLCVRSFFDWHAKAQRLSFL